MKKLLLFACALGLSACSTMQPPRYSVSVDNIQALKVYNGTRAGIATLAPPARFDANCRLMGPIEPADNLTMPQFFAKAFNDELKMAGIYAPDGVQITGAITKVEFSSVEGLTNGYWDLGWELKGANGHTLAV